MFHQVNEIIEVNLQLLFSSKNQSLIFSEFKDKNGKKLVQVIEFFQLMEKKKLIEIENNKCTLTELGENIVKNGGWLEYLKKK
jgi:predicted methyltransferase